MVWFDSYAAAVSLLCSALFEALALVYGYGEWLTFLLHHLMIFNNFHFRY